MDGIQSLLQAEKDASERVEKARKAKVERLKASKVEAEKEIEEFRAQREQEFAQYAEQHKGSSGVYRQKLEEQTTAAMAQVQKDVAANKEDVVQLLLKVVATVAE